MLNTLHWQLPFHSSLVTRQPYLGQDNWRLRYRFFSHYKVPLTFRYSWKRLRKRRSKNLIKFPQVYITFVLQYAHCFEKKNKHWLSESWETWLPERLKCTIVILNTSHWQLPFHSIPVTRRPYLGHDNWRLRYRFFPHYKVSLTFRYSWKRLKNRRSKILIKFSQMYIAFVLCYAHCFQKKKTYWLNESWKTRLPERLKCTIGERIYII